jgi:hypothetical protein
MFKHKNVPGDAGGGSSGSDSIEELRVATAAGTSGDRGGSRTMAESSALDLDTFELALFAKNDRRSVCFLGGIFRT